MNQEACECGREIKHGRASTKLGTPFVKGKRTKSEQADGVVTKKNHSNIWILISSHKIYPNLLCTFTPILQANVQLLHDIYKYKYQQTKYEKRIKEVNSFWGNDETLLEIEHD